MVQCGISEVAERIKRGATVAIYFYEIANHEECISVQVRMCMQCAYVVGVGTKTL